jgi:hypothetical protein
MSGRHRVIAGHDKADATDGNDSPKRSESAYASAHKEKKLHGCNLPMERCNPVRMDRCLQSRILGNLTRGSIEPVLQARFAER